MGQNSKRYLCNHPKGTLAIIEPNCPEDDPREARIIAKTLFELGRRLLTLADMPDGLMTGRTVTEQETMLEHYRMNVHFVARDWDASIPQCNICESDFDISLVHYRAYDGPVKLTTVGEIHVTDLPTDRTFRNAWEHTNSQVSVNMPKARVIHMGKIRRARDTTLAALDVPLFKAMEDGDAAEQARIGQLKRSLRDIPETFDLEIYTTPEELKAAWPAIIERGL